MAISPQKVSFADYEAGNYPKQDEWLYSSHWYKDFDAMAFKTMLRQLISKWGIMSVDLQTAMEQDDFMTESDYLTAQDAPAPVPAIETPDAAPEPAPESPDAAPVESVNLDDLVDDDAV
ncbi:recombinase RecT [Candidatus Avoscillospira sp. LCP25S3_F1]|uniref:recombinase RecT n=1 Tax=Candidatus Avoscillospira sp. LCP25S3_F1 TaxID=3438825 RepID=UPI003F937A9C